MTNFPYSNDPTVIREEQTFLTRVFAWMSFGLVLSAVTAYWAGTNASTAHFLQHGGWKVLLVLLAPLAILFLMQAVMDGISAGTAYVLYAVFCAVDGFGLGIVFTVYTTGSLAKTLLITAGMFGGMAVFGYATKRDLSGLGSILFMALWGLILAMIVNLFWASSGLYWITTAAGILIFCGLTAYDVQKIKKYNVLGNAGTDADKKEAIWGAIALYLDFVNLFLFLLRIFGQVRD